MANARYAVRIVAFSKYPHTFRALPKNALKTVANSNHASSSPAEDAVPVILSDSKYPCTTGITASAQYTVRFDAFTTHSHTFRALAGNRNARLTRSDDAEPRCAITFNANSSCANTRDAKATTTRTFTFDTSHFTVR